MSDLSTRLSLLWQSFTEVVLGEAASEPAAAPVAGERFSPAAGGVRVPFFLPDLPLAHFIGRENEVRDILEKLDANALVTLVGIGGIGKTRLAIEVARRIAGGEANGSPELIGRLQSQCADGICYVPFKTLDSGAGELEIWRAIARGVVPGWRTSKDLLGDPVELIKAHLAEHLAAHRHLILLDSCEHLHQPTVRTAVDSLCRQGAKTLVTSRQRLNLKGLEGELPYECAYPLAELDYPGRKAINGPVSELQRFEAVRLFAIRAALDEYGPRTGASEEQREAALLEADRRTTALLAEEKSLRQIARICRELQGIPLAIALAASRVSEYRRIYADTPQLLEAMGNDLQARLLENLKVARDDPHFASFDSRQRTMRECLLWSLSSLTAAQQELFRRLAVLRGAWPMWAALEICQARPEDHQALADAHLISTRAVRGSARYTFLDPVRELAAELLIQPDKGQPPSEEARLRAESEHVRVFIALLSERPELVQEEQENIQLALARAARAEEAAAYPDLRHRLQEAAETALNILERQFRQPDSPNFVRYLPFAENALQLAEGANRKLAAGTLLSTLKRARDIYHILAGRYQLSALFGDATPDYSKLHDMDDDEWLEEAKKTVDILARLPEDLRHPAHILLACMVFITHDWWDGYLREDSKAGAALERWHSQRGAADDPLYASLMQFESAYPVKSDWERRAGDAERWKIVREALQKVGDALNLNPALLDSPGAQISQPDLFLLGIVERYQGEAHFYLRDERARRPPSADADWEQRYRNSERAFGWEQDGFFRFYRQWTQVDLASCYAEAGRPGAQELCLQVLADEREECAGDARALDLEILADAYRVLARVHADERRFAQAAACFNAALFFAYVFLLAEYDAYALTFYTEHYQRMLEGIKPILQPGNLLGLRRWRRDASGDLEAAYDGVRRFWQPHWESRGEAPPATLQAAEAGNVWEAVRGMLPAPPEAAELSAPDAAGRFPELERIDAFLAATAGRLKSAPDSENALPPHFAEFVGILAGGDLLAEAVAELAAESPEAAGETEE